MFFASGVLCFCIYFSSNVGMCVYGCDSSNKHFAHGHAEMRIISLCAYASSGHIQASHTMQWILNEVCPFSAFMLSFSNLFIPHLHMKFTCTINVTVNVPCTRCCCCCCCCCLHFLYGIFIIFVCNCYCYCNFSSMTFFMCFSFLFWVPILFLAICKYGVIHIYLCSEVLHTQFFFIVSIGRLS